VADREDVLAQPARRRRRLARHHQHARRIMQRSVQTTGCGTSELDREDHR
jgi:hypothetical protein